MDIANLQGFMALAIKNEFDAKWCKDGLIISEQRRIVLWVDGRATIYGMAHEEMEELTGGALTGPWYVSYILGGPPFWTTSDPAAVHEAASKYGLPIVRGF